MVGRPVEGGGQPRAAVEPAGVARIRVPGARSVAELAVQAPAWTSSSNQVRSRGHSRSSASCATSTAPSLTVSNRRSARRATTARARGVQLGERDAAPDDHTALVLVGQAQQQPARRRLLTGLEPE